MSGFRVWGSTPNRTLIVSVPPMVQRGRGDGQPSAGACADSPCIAAKPQDPHRTSRVAHTGQPQPRPWQLMPDKPSNPDAADAGPDVYAAAADREQEPAGAQPANRGPEDGKSGPAPAHQGPISLNWPKLKAWAALRAQVWRMVLKMNQMTHPSEQGRAAPSRRSCTSCTTGGCKGQASAKQHQSFCLAALHAGKAGGHAVLTAWSIHQCCISHAALCLTARAAPWRP